jgi:hypothetical protein
MHLRYGYSSAGILGGHKARGPIRCVRVPHLEPLALRHEFRDSGVVYQQCKVLAAMARETARKAKEERRGTHS